MKIRFSSRAMFTDNLRSNSSVKARRITLINPSICRWQISRVVCFVWVRKNYIARCWLICITIYWWRTHCYSHICGVKSFNLDAFHNGTKINAWTRQPLCTSEHYFHFCARETLGSALLDSKWIRKNKKEFQFTHIWHGRSSLGPHGVLRRRTVAWLLHLSRNQKTQQKWFPKNSLRREKETKTEENQFQTTQKSFLIDVNKLSNIYANRRHENAFVRMKSFSLIDGGDCEPSRQLRAFSWDKLMTIYANSDMKL